MKVILSFTTIPPRFKYIKNYLENLKNPSKNVKHHRLLFSKVDSDHMAVFYLAAKIYPNVGMFI